MRNKQPPKNKPLQQTARFPENRVGTKSHARYGKFLGVPSSVVGAKPRHWAKAIQMCESPSRVLGSQQTGRIVRACYRNLMSAYGEHCESQIHM